MTRIPVVERIMGQHDRVALRNRALLDERHVHAVNIMASPGAGKTSVILSTLAQLRGRLRLGVIEGDLASSLDADTVRAAGIPAVQVNTGNGCHLDAIQVGQALAQLPLSELDLVLIENVGNLVCPVAFALGEHTRLVIASVPEGDDKPIKYPSIYSAVDVLLLNKIDLLPYVRFDQARFERLVRGLNPGIAMFAVSCTTGEGIQSWADWLVRTVRRE
jgi:hydrogenase nickel incorporation protein HypB